MIRAMAVAVRAPHRLITQLEALLAPEALLREPAATDRFRRDRAEWAPAGQPLAVARPRTTEEVRAVVAACAEHRVPVVPRGAGTGLSGGANAVDGCIVLATERMDAILEIDPVEQLARVQPGVVNDVLTAAAADHGLWYPPDPVSSPWSTIGGNVATDAGGLSCVKYGVTRDYVLGLEVVVGAGEVVRLGRRTAKGVAGYDLCSLFVGSEGTLGVITEITVRLRPPAQAPRTIVGVFPRLTDAGAAACAVASAAVTPSTLELLDRECLRAVNAARDARIDEDAAALLLAQVDEPGQRGDRAAAAMRDAFERHGATWSAVSTVPDEARALIGIRELAFPAIERMGVICTEDVCVPRARLVEMLAEVERIAAEHDVRIATIAHAGDGNVHPEIITPRGDAAARQRAERAFEELMDAALRLGGTITGEHGVGLLKRAGLLRELGPAVSDLQRTLKAALDPRGTFNPGKVFR
jgi:glycolate oxidase